MYDDLTTMLVWDMACWWATKERVVYGLGTSKLAPSYIVILPGNSHDCELFNAFLFQLFFSFVLP